jgi:hypothetical protein
VLAQVVAQTSRLHEDDFAVENFSEHADLPSLAFANGTFSHVA